MRLSLAVNGKTQSIASLQGAGFLNAHINMSDRPKEGERSNRFLYPRSVISHVLSFIFATFTAFIGAWHVLGKLGIILLPIIVLLERIVDAYRDRSDAKKR